MRHVLCLALCWIAAPSLAQQSSPDPNRTGGADFGAQQYAAGPATDDDIVSAPALDGEAPVPSDGGQGRTNRARRQPAQDAGLPAVPNPFDLPSESMMGGYGGMEEMEEDYMDSGEMDEDMMDMGMGMGGGMEMGMGGMGDYEGGDGMGMYGMGSMSSADQRFQAGLQRAIAAIRKSDTEADQKTLLNFVRRAFEDRYDESIQSRQKQLLQIKQRVAKLEAELKRREAAKSRVVEVQLQSVQLAAEGLLDLDGQ
jgi:hypothetical protein